MANTPLDHFRSGDLTVGVVGLGYVGLPLSVEIARVMPFMGCDPFQVKPWEVSRLFPSEQFETLKLTEVPELDRETVALGSKSSITVFPAAGPSR